MKPAAPSLESAVALNIRALSVRCYSRIEHVELKGGLAVFRWSLGVANPGPYPAVFAQFLAPRAVEGVMRSEALAQACADESQTLVALPDYRIAHPKLADAVAELGLAEGIGWLQAQGVPLPVNPRVYTALVEEGARLEQLVRVDGRAGVLFTVAGVPLPAAIRCSPVRGYFDARHYDLDKLAELLQKHPRVRFLDAKGSPVPRAPASSPDARASKGLTFLYTPTRTEAVALWMRQCALDGAEPGGQVHRALFELDLLRARAQGVVRADPWRGK